MVLAVEAWRKEAVKTCSEVEKLFKERRFLNLGKRIQQLKEEYEFQVLEEVNTYGRELDNLSASKKLKVRGVPVNCEAFACHLGKEFDQNCVLREKKGKEDFAYHFKVERKLVPKAHKILSEVNLPGSTSDPVLKEFFILDDKKEAAKADYFKSLERRLEESKIKTEIKRKLVDGKFIKRKKFLSYVKRAVKSSEKEELMVFYFFQDKT